MKRIFVLVSFFLLLMNSAALAKPQTYTATGEYIMSSKETLEDGVQHAREDALRLISESVGVYVESQSEAKDQELTRDEIKTISSSIIRVVSESGPVIVQHGKGLDIKMTVTAEADTDQLFTEQKKKNDKLREQLDVANYSAGENFNMNCMSMAREENGEGFMQECIDDAIKDDMNPWMRAFGEKWNAILLLRHGKYEASLDALERAAEEFGQASDSSGFMAEDFRLEILAEAADICAYYCEDWKRAESYLQEKDMEEKLQGSICMGVTHIYQHAKDNIRRLKMGEKVQESDLTINEIILWAKPAEY